MNEKSAREPIVPSPLGRKNVAVALMQPYFLPYLGYFNLIHAVDIFVVYDDVQYMKGGWINRNRILLGGKPHYITLSVSREHDGNNISNRYLAEPLEDNIGKVLRQLENAYKKAPYFKETMEVVNQISEFEQANVAQFLTHQLQVLNKMLELNRQILSSSELPKRDGGLRGPERVLAICEALACSRYVNAMGGRELYDSTQFYEHGIELNFCRPSSIAYQQFSNEFVPNLSIVDVIMFNGLEKTKALLKEYTLV